MTYSARINLRALAAVSKFASTDETRYYVMGVKVEIEPRAVTYIATDGHTLLVHRDEMLDDAEVDPDNDITGHFIIPTAQCRAFKLKKDDFAVAALSGEPDEMTLMRGQVGVVFKAIDGEYPDWRKVVPSIPLAQGIGQFNGHYVERFMKASEELGLGLPFIAHNGQTGPALVRFASRSDTLGVIMPFRAEDKLRTEPLPAWMEAPRAAAE